MNHIKQPQPVTRKAITWVSRLYACRPAFVSTLLFVIISLVCSYVFYRRFPDNFHYANFFAEDGQHFVQNILDKGFMSAVFTPFNGYFIWGIYLLTGLGFILNTLFFGGYFINLPEAMAVTSYLFLGACAALPILLLRSYLRLSYLLAIALLLCLLPMPTFDYITIGTIGNLKFAFFYIAFLLLLYRMKLPRSSRKIFALDAGLLVCCYTIAEAYVLLPFLLLCDGLYVHRKQLLDKNNWLLLTKRSNISLWSFITLGVLVSLQVLMVIMRGTPDLPGYLDEPYQFGKSIEIFIGRMFLFPFLSAGYSHLNDVLVIIAALVGVGLIAKFGDRDHRWIYITGFLSIILASAVLIFNRTGVSVHYDHYQSSGFDNFFYPQNYIAVVMGMVLLHDIGQRVAWFKRLHLIWIILLLVALGEIRTNNKTPPNNFMPYQIGTLKQQAASICPSGKPQVQITVYPFNFLHMDMPRQRLCSVPLQLFDTDLENFGLSTLADDALNIFPTQATFTQTFTSHKPRLDGLAVYLSTYGQTRLHGYHLRLYKADCKTELRVAALPDKVRDNAYAVIRFEALDNSNGQDYCFTITPDNGQSPQLAVQLSRETSYSEGQLLVSGAPYRQDVVFQAIH